MSTKFQAGRLFRFLSLYVCRWQCVSSSKFQ